MVLKFCDALKYYIDIPSRTLMGLWEPHWMLLRKKIGWRNSNNISWINPYKVHWSFMQLNFCEITQVMNIQALTWIGYVFVKAVSWWKKTLRHYSTDFRSEFNCVRSGLKWNGLQTCHWKDLNIHLIKERAASI